MRRLAVAALVLALAGCGEKREPDVPGAADPAATARPPSDGELIRRVLARRRAPAAARRLGVRDFRYELVTLDLDGTRARALVRVAYRVRGIAGRFTTQRPLQLRRRDGRWRITDEGGRRRRQPWEIDRYDRRRTEHFVLFVPRGLDPEAAGLTSALEDGYARMRDVLSAGRLRRRYLVVITRDADRTRRLTSRITGLESLAALTDTEVRETGSAQEVQEVVSQRLIVVWPALIETDQERRGTVVTHELTHAVLAGRTSGRTPAWLVEGMALYISGDRRDALGGPVSLKSLRRPDAIARLSGSGQGDAYAYASAAAHHIADRYGEDELFDLYDAFNDPELKGGPAELQDAAIRRVLGISASQLEAELG